MTTMPPRSHPGQADPPAISDAASDWFASSSGQALLASEDESVRGALAERPGQAWLWLVPAPQTLQMAGHGLRLDRSAARWVGPVHCALPLPLANESVATVVIQHTAHGGRRGSELLAECARVLVPGGRLWLYALNPLSPYRWRWSPGLGGGNGLAASEPMSWRRRLREVGLEPDAVSQGLGPRWRIETSPGLQQGPGVRAAYLLRADKRTTPLTPLRNRAALRVGNGVPAA